MRERGPVGSRPNEIIPQPPRGRPPGSVGQLRGPNILADGSCDTDVDWVGITGTISVSAASPYEGAGAVRLATTSANGRAYFAGITAGKTYRMTGVFRGDGVIIPRLTNVGGTPEPFADGTTSTAWQAFDATFLAAEARVRLYGIGASGNWVEIDDLYISEE